MRSGWGLIVCCPEAPLLQSMAQPTCVHTLMCALYARLFCFRVARILEALSDEDSPLSAVLCLPAWLRVCHSVQWPGQNTNTQARKGGE